MMANVSERMVELEKKVANKSYSDQGSPVLTGEDLNMGRQPNMNNQFLSQLLGLDQAPLAFAGDDINMGRQKQARAPEDEENNMGGHTMDRGSPKSIFRPLDENDEEVNRGEHAMDKGRPNFQPSDEYREDPGGEDVNMSELNNNQPEKADTPERQEINTGGHTMNTERAEGVRRGKRAERQLDEDEEDFGYYNIEEDGTDSEVR